MNYSTHVPAFQMSLRAAVAAALSVAIARWLELQFPIYAMISAVIVTDLKASETWKLGLLRMAGSAVGAVLGALTCAVLRPNAWEAGLAIFAAMFLSHFLRLRNSAKVAGYVCGIVLLAFGDHPWEYALHRTIETALGIAMAMLVSLVPKLISAEEPKRQES
ncbi:MAG TPA: FUSC family protein [Chthoniobacterales bacterium]|jgi:uncharacterized membrane protein YgaE (UPF0421/DUF939 family)